MYFVLFGNIVTSNELCSMAHHGDEAYCTFVTLPADELDSLLLPLRLPRGCNWKERGKLRCL